MLAILNIDDSVSQVWRVRHPEAGRNFVEDWNAARLKEMEAQGVHGHYTDDILQRMLDLGWEMDEQPGWVEIGD